MAGARMRVLATFFAAGTLALAGCRGGGEKADDIGAGVQVDTTNDDVMDGMSATDIEKQAQPMTPEQAAAQGLADTITHLENLGARDTAPAGRPGDTLSTTPSPDTIGRRGVPVDSTGVGTAQPPR